MIPDPLGKLLECHCMYEARGPKWPGDFLAMLSRDRGIKAKFQSQLAHAVTDSTPEPEEFGRVVHQRGEFDSREDVEGWLLDLWLDLFPDEKIGDFLSK